MRRAGPPDPDMQARGPASGGRRPPISRWKKLLLAVSVAAMAVGGGLHLLKAAGSAGPAPTAERRSAGGLATPKALVADPQPAAGGVAQGAVSADPNAARRWEPAVFRLGFSFFAGFCLGYALRIFFRMSVLVIGMILLALFGLQYLGLIHVDWSAIAGHYDDALSWLRGQTAGFRHFITGQLPSAATAVVGLAAGWRK